MLVLSRKSGEKIIIVANGVEMEFTALIEQGKVRLVFDAPDDFDIFRSEVYTPRKKGEKNGSGHPRTAVNDIQPAGGLQGLSEKTLVRLRARHSQGS